MNKPEAPKTIAAADPAVGPTASAARDTRLRILLVEDHPAMREGLRSAIHHEPDLRVVGEASTWREAFTLVGELVPDVVVLDLNLPDGNGWNLLEQLRAEGSLPPTLVLSVCEEVLYGRRLLQAGARGYLTKDAPLTRVLGAIRDVHAGRLVASPDLSSELMAEALGLSQPPESAPTPVPAAESSELSDRELQVLGLLARQLTGREVGLQLGLSEKTVSTYKTRLMKKLGARSTGELVERFRSWQGA